MVAVMSKAIDNAIVAVLEKRGPMSGAMLRAAVEQRIPWWGRLSGAVIHRIWCLEELGMIASEWEASARYPRRRIYRLAGG